MGYVVMILLGYLLGCSNMAVYLGKLKKVDIRQGGSGNPGASNAVLLLGWKAGILTGAHDILKAILPVLLARWLFPDLPYVELLAGVAAIVGHIYPVFMKFKGGKGLASYVGMTLAVHWLLGLGVMVTIALATLLSGYIVVGTVVTVLAVPVAIGLLSGDWIAAAILAVPTLLILWKHRENYPRILNGTEINLKAAFRGDHRKDKKGK